MFTTDLLGAQIIVPSDLYQRNQDKGWTKLKQGQYVASVFAGTASAAFVINKKSAQARLVDGGHRKKAIELFKQGKVGMPSPHGLIFWNQVFFVPQL